MSTRISLRTGGTLVVAESPEEVQRTLDDGGVHTFHVVAGWQRDYEVTEHDVALRLDHVSMLARADV